MWSKDEIRAASSLTGRMVNDLTKEESELAETLRSKGLLDTESEGFSRGSMWVWTCEALSRNAVREILDGSR